MISIRSAIGRLLSLVLVVLIGTHSPIGARSRSKKIMLAGAVTAVVGLTYYWYVTNKKKTSDKKADQEKPLKKQSALAGLIAGAVTYATLSTGAGQSGAENRYSYIPHDDYFKAVTGYDEESFKNGEALEVKVRKNGEGALELQNKSGQIFQMGLWKQMSIGELRAQSSRIAQPGHGVFNVVEGVATTPHQWFYPLVDVASLQKNNPGAVFQVASNFNGLEAVNKDQDIEKQLLSEYWQDKTQGPAAAISALPGTILRRYGMFHQGALTGWTAFDLTWGQKNITAGGLAARHEVNLLHDIVADVSTGLGMSRAGYADISRVRRAANDADIMRMQVGYHAGVQVTFGRETTDKKREKLFPANKDTIDQVYTAAIDLSAQVDARAWAQAVLYAAYEGTLRSAFIHGKKKVFLTLIGGGVFNNNAQHIIQAIERMKPFIISSGLDVTLVAYQLTAEQAACRNRLVALVEETGGTYVQHHTTHSALLCQDDRLQHRLFSVGRYAAPLSTLVPIAQQRVRAFTENYSRGHVGYSGAVKIYAQTGTIKHTRNHVTRIEVWDMDTFEAAKRLLAHKPAVLDMANEFHPGGGPGHGCSAQEEQLCYRSPNLFTALERCKEYAGGRDWFMTTQKHTPFITESGAIYIPQVKVIRDCEANGFRPYAPAEVFAVDVIASAAYDLRGLAEPRGYEAGTKAKMRTQLRVALEQGHDTLLLSAYGCGAFVNDPKKVAAYYRDVLNEPEFKSAFKLVVFSIFGGGNNRQVFARTFGC